MLSISSAQGRNTNREGNICRNHMYSRIATQTTAKEAIVFFIVRLLEMKQHDSYVSAVRISLMTRGERVWISSMCVLAYVACVCVLHRPAPIH